MMGLIGINRKQIEEQVVKMLGGRHAPLKADVGGLTAEKFVTKMSDEGLCNFYVQMQRKRKRSELRVQHIAPEEVTQVRRR